MIISQEGGLKMRDGWVRKVFVIGVIILFVGVGFSSAFNNKEIKLNNTEVINSDKVESTEWLPDLIITDIEREIIFNEPPYPTICYDIVYIHNIGSYRIAGYTNLTINIYRYYASIPKLESSINYNIEVDLEPNAHAGYKLNSNDIEGIFFNVVVFINFDKTLPESNYRNNVAGQKFHFQFLWWVWRYEAWIKMGPIYYPYSISNSFGI